MFQIVWPWVWLILPLPILVRWLLPAAAVQLGAALQVPFLQRLQTVTQGNITQTRIAFWKLLLMGLIWLLLIFAASRPQWLGSVVNLPRSGRDIMLAVDISGSMSLKDMQLNGKPASRIAVVKAAASQFIKNRVGDRLGLILFGTHAYLQTPLTFDRKTVQQMLNDASIGLAGRLTAIGDGIGLAVNRLQKYPKDSRVLILLTDGVNNQGVSPLDAAKVAAKYHIRIYTIGLGSVRYMVNTFFGPQLVNPSQDLDEKTLQQIAELTGGLYFRAKNTQDLMKVYQALNQLEPVVSEKDSFRPVTPLYYWPLAIALILTLLWAIVAIAGCDKFITLWNGGRNRC